MGARGPVPKRSTQRRRKNAESKPETSPAADESAVPAPHAKWHPAARAWYESLGRSGQSRFYEPSDWATAWLIAESISRDLKPQFVGLSERIDVETGDRITEPVMAACPLKGASLSAYLKAMTALLVTEGDRRRARLELVRGGAERSADPDVPNLDDFRDRLAR